MNHTTKNKPLARLSRLRLSRLRPARLRKVTSPLLATIVLSVTAPLAHAELGDSSGAREPRVGSRTIIQPPESELASRVGSATTPLFLLVPIGVSGEQSFRSSTHHEPPKMVTFGGDDTSLCLGARCAPKSPSSTEIEEKSSAGAGSKRLVQSIALGRAALALFSNPVPKRSQSVALAVSPMFALGGAGFQMRCGFW